MLKALQTPDEALRIETLRKYAILDTLPEQALDDLTSLAAQICGAPIALVSLVDDHRQWFKAKIGLQMAETPRDISFCGHALHHRDLFIVSDALQDPRFADNPLVLGQPGIRFYAGAPLVSPEGPTLGALCVIDHEPRALTESQQSALKVLARQVIAHLVLRRHTRELIESEERLKIVTDTSRVGLVIVNRDRHYVYANDTYSEMLDLPAVAIVGRKVSDILDEVYEEQVRPRLDRAFAGERVSYILRKSKKHGYDRHYDIRYEPRIMDGEVPMVVVVVTDITEQIRNETIVTHFPAIIESTDDAIISKTLEGIVTSWNPAAERMFGYKAQEIIGRPITVLFPQDRLQEESEILSKISIGERVRHFETVRVRKDGRALDVSATISPILNDRHEIIGVSKIVRDITEHKKAEDQLRWKTAFFEAQVNSALDGILVVDGEGKTILQNKPMLALWKFPEEITEQVDDGPRLKWVTSQVKNPEGFIEKIAHLYSHPEEISRDEIELVDGRFFDRYSAPVRGADGKYYGRIWVFRDITEWKRASDQIAEQAALLDKARDAILVRDLNGKIMFWSNGAERVYGWPRRDAVGASASEILYSDPKQFAEVNELTIIKGEWSGELQHLTKSRGEIVVEARWTLIRDHEGRPKSILAIDTDVTDRKKIEAQFLRAQRMESIGTLAGGVAHDLNNILAPIMMSIEVLKTMTDRPQAASILNTIEVSAKRGADIVRQVLSFARGMQGERIEIQPKHLLHDMESIVRNTFPKDIRLHFAVPSNPWTILGDPTQVHQILLNLCVNARDAMPHGGNLTVGVENCVLDEQYVAMNTQAKIGRYVMLSVTDSGTGIPQAIIDKIFEPFFTTKEQTKGTGLGLSTVAAVVKSHGGIVNVYSEPGKGTTFKVYLPATEIGSAGSKDSTEHASLPRGNGELILVIDDEASILTITGQTLEAFGYRVMTATDGADALAVYVQHKSDVAVVLTDMMMPVMDGPATIYALQRINPAVRIIAASGLNANGGVAKASGAGIRFFLTKPYTAETLLKSIRSILDDAPKGTPNGS